MDQLIKCFIEKDNHLRVDTGFIPGIDIFPIKITMRWKLNNEIFHEVTLNQNCWMTSPVDNDNSYFIISDKNGTELHRGDIRNFSDPVQNFFDIWASRNYSASGIAIGTNNGTTGEWVAPVMANQLRALLIEPTHDIFEKLKSNYKGFTNVNFLEKLVTVKGGITKFHTWGEGYTNSVHELVFPEDIVIDHLELDSISVYELLFQNTPKWIHMDTEGLDFELVEEIIRLDTLLPEIIIYEHIFYTTEQHDILIEKLKGKGYMHIKGIGYNSLAYRNNNEV